MLISFKKQITKTAQIKKKTSSSLPKGLNRSHYLKFQAQILKNI